jgi:hypothetical protein
MIGVRGSSDRSIRLRDASLLLVRSCPMRPSVLSYNNPSAAIVVGRSFIRDKAKSVIAFALLYGTWIQTNGSSVSNVPSKSSETLHVHLSSSFRASSLSRRLDKVAES